MKTEVIFYIIGGFFAIAALIYFTWEYVLAFPKEIKLLILACLTIMFFFLGAIFRERDI